MGTLCFMFGVDINKLGIMVQGHIRRQKKCFDSFRGRKVPISPLTTLVKQLHSKVPKNQRNPMLEKDRNTAYNAEIRSTRQLDLHGACTVDPISASTDHQYNPQF